jgi:riboflavin synthase
VFTGLIESLGTIRALGKDRLTVSLANPSQSQILEGLAIGDSVAVDGVCLTVEQILATGFVATTSPETLDRTTLGQSSYTASQVNLERSLRVGGKLGGHFVTGHVDAIGCLLDTMATETSWEMTFSAPSSLLDQWQLYISPYLVSKGSIAVNGISLTIANCDRQGSWFKVAVIPHTYSATNLCLLNPGNWVNLESDILGKYVDRLLAYRLGKNHLPEDISLDFLAEHGYT